MNTQPFVIRFLQDLIRIPSPSGKEEQVVRRVAQEMDATGAFDAVWFDQLGNVIGEIGSGRVNVLLDAHIDTVGVGDRGRWEHDPFAAEIVNGQLVGRGAVDEKPAMACMLYGAAAVSKRCREQLKVYVVGSVLEEDCDGYPLEHLIEEEGVRPDYVVLGEPTDLNVYRGQRGRMELTVLVRGTAAHGAHCDRGDNAVYKMAPIISEIESLHARLRHDALLGKGSITISRIESTSPSLCSVADSCTIYLDRRLTRGETKETAIAELEGLPSVQRVQAQVAVRRYHGVAWTGRAVNREAYFPSWVLDDDHPLVRVALAAAEEVNPRPPRLGVWTFSTNGVATMGRYGIPTVGYAPGREELAHSVHEAVAVEDVITAVRFYTKLLERLALQV
ncbi:MAG: YgeY family selenium metabolism-linked hydrolase [bacterium]|nr:YgeY family selenium metabolism-linked hydrolase [bacterium]